MGKGSERESTSQHEEYRQLSLPDEDREVRGNHKHWRESQNREDMADNIRRIVFERGEHISARAMPSSRDQENPPAQTLDECKLKRRRGVRWTCPHGVCDRSTPRVRASDGWVLLS